MRDDLVTIVTPPTEFEANILAIVLRDNNIEAHVFAAPIMGVGVALSGGTIGVPLQVPKHDLERATKVLSENKHRSIDIDWDELELSGSNAPYKASVMQPIAKIIAIVIILSFVGTFVASILNVLFVK